MAERLQFFSFHPSGFYVSDLVEGPVRLDDFFDWDYLLMDRENVLTGYVNKEPRWSTIEDGYNGWGFEFMTPGWHNYSEYPQYEKLAK